ncbi:hypothetical protein ACLHDG_08095 [Sulfurovum sp. CS9]|uniref:hypothetical protein n=1 Tax=Sulfurovum sp. CS9 TaxID=3391146 RepID=UPI0039ED0698
MKEQTFGQLLIEQAYERITIGDYSGMLDFFHDILDTFEKDSGFLDAIPREDWLEVIDKLISPIYDYTSKPAEVKMNKKSPPAKRPKDKIEQEIKVIEKFQELLGVICTAHTYCYFPHAKEIEEALNTAQILKDDLKNQTFDIFSKVDYYSREVPSKTEISNILDDIIKKYNLKGCSLDKDQLIANLPS